MIETILFIAGLLIGFLAAWVIITKKLTENNLHKTEELNAKLQEVTQAKLQAETELKILKESKTEMTKEIELLTNKILSESKEQFTKRADEIFNKYSVNLDKDLKLNKSEIQTMINPLKESVERHEKLVHNFQINSNKAFGSLEGYLTELNKQQQSLQKETGALVNALKSPKVRGRWGEIGLQRIVEFSGMNQYCDFSTQVHTNTEEGSMRPDMIVRLPANKKIVVDSKLPLSAYLNMLETDDENEKKILAKSHASAVLTHVKDLSKKAYWSQFDDTVDFVVLYIEIESAFGAALIENKNLITDAIANRIVFATPTTLIALLQTVAYGWKQHEATENALEIWKLSKDIYERTAVFSEHMSKTGKTINSLVKAYNDMTGSWERRVMPGFNKIQSYGISSEKKSIETPDSIEILPREKE